MNPGTFDGIDNATTAQMIRGYTQTAVMQTSQTVPVPSGCKRIEALLCGGGGASGGFGGANIFEIPLTGQPLQVVIGAGGPAVVRTSATSGSPTYIVSAGMKYAETGGGGSQGTRQYARSGGGGTAGQGGGPPPIGKLLWSIYPQVGSNGVGTCYSYYGAGTCGTSPAYTGSIGYVGFGTGGNGSFGGGGGGPGTSTTAGYGAAGGGDGGTGVSVGNYGGGGGSAQPSGAGAAGGSLTAVTIWGLTGKAAGGSPYNGQGGGGGGLLGAGSGKDGGNGGGGGGTTYNNGWTAGAGGDGFAVIRFYY